MLRAIFFHKIFLLILLVISFTACFDKPDEFVAPTWDADVHVPITSKKFELMEIVERDSSLLKASSDPSTLGLIYIGDTQSVSTITIEDELKLDPFETSFAQTIGPIEVSVPIPAASEIRVEDWAPDVTSGSFQVFPEQEGNVTIEIKGVETVERVLADSGYLRVLVWNKLPVEIVLRGIRIQNSVDKSIIAERSASNPSDWITIPPFRSENLFFPIDGKEITNALEYEGTIWSQGSNGQQVQVPSEAGTTVLALFQDLVIASATASLPVQSFQFNDSIELDDSTKIEEALINSGSARLVVNNNIDANLTADIMFDNLYTDSGGKYALNIPLNRNEANKVIEIPSLKDWSIRTPIPGIPTNELSYSISVITDSTGEISTINKNDSISFNLNFDELVFESFEGKLKPTIVELDESGFKLDYGDFNNQLEYGEINFKDAIFYLSLYSTIDLDLLLNGNISATNGLTSNSLPLTDIVLPTFTPEEINITELLNGFSSELPDSFAIQGSALLNPLYEVAKVSMGDSIFGSIDYEIPLNVGIAGGSFKDTLEIDLGDVDRDDINRLNYGEVTFTIRNAVPVGLTFKSMVMDSVYNDVLPIPTGSNSQVEISIPKPEMSADGDVMLAGENTQTITLNGDEIKMLLDNPYLMIEVSFSTSGLNNDPVKFKTSNNISFDVIAKAEYRVDL